MTAVNHVLHFTLPGYGDLYFQEVAVNLKTEEFGIEAQKNNREVVSLFNFI